MPFARYPGIDYPGAQTPSGSLKGSVYMAGHAAAIATQTGRGIAEWLVEWLAGDVATRAGIGHGFSFPLRYFKVHGLPGFLGRGSFASRLGRAFISGRSTDEKLLPPALHHR